jgi:solute carrier family 35
MAESKALLQQQQLPSDAQVLEAKEIDFQEDNGPGEALSLSSWWQRVGSSTFYCVGSFIITLTNKAVLTSYGFPSSEVLGLAQLITTVVCLLAAHLSGGIRIPMLTMDVFVQVWPLPGLFLGNLLFGLGAMRFLSLPIFISLRRFTIAMTMVAEVFILGVVIAIIIFPVLGLWWWLATRQVCFY